MPSRRIVLLLVFLTPVATLAIFQGMLTAGLLPLAAFAPLYAVARASSSLRDPPRVEGTRAVAAASVGAALALAPALLLLATGVDPVGSGFATLGMFLLAAGLGSLAGLATAPPARPLTVEEQRRWVFVEALTDKHARGIAALFIVTLLASTLLALLREAPLLPADVGRETIPQALFGDVTASGYLVLPSAASAYVIALPLTLAPLALGFLIPMRTTLPLVAGGVALAALIPVAIALDLPLETPGGSFVPLSLRPSPGLDAARALAPVGAGALLGAGLATLAHAARSTRFDGRALWALIGAALALVMQGVVGLGLVAGVALAGVALTWRSERAMLGAALLVGTLAGMVLGRVIDAPRALGLGALVGVVVGGAVATASTGRVLRLPTESLRSVRTLWYFAPAVLVGGALAYLAARAVAADAVPFEAPHARALAAALDAVVTGRGLLLVAWGLAAGVLLQSLGVRAAMVAVGFLAGPIVALFVFLGSVLRSLWETRLLERAQRGFVLRGQLGYDLLRVHVLVVGVLAGEAVVLGLKGWML